MIGYILAFSLFSIVLAFVFETMNGRSGNVPSVAFLTGIAALLLNWAIIGLGTPTFSHWMTGGYPLLFFLNLTIPVVMSAIVSVPEGANTGATSGTFIIVLALVVYSILRGAIDPSWCNTDEIRQQIGLLNLQPAPDGMVFHETALDQLIRVPASAALTKAGNALSGGENVAIGNYLQPNRAYLTMIQGVPTYVIDLRVSDALGFRNANKIVPGYLLVNAVNNNSLADFRRGYTIRYVPDGMFSLDLDRKAYFEFALENSIFLDDLDGMEVNEALDPSYTGTIMSHVIGFKGVQPTGVFHFDPTTGKWEVIPLADIPTKLPHLDRVYPLDWVTDQVKLWGGWANHEACTPNSVGQVQIDSSNDVITPDGVEYQISMTGMGDDPSMTSLITVNARTGQGYIFSLTGKSIESIKDAFTPLTKKIRVDGLTVDECELHAIDGVNTVYCIFTSADQYGNTNVSGYGFVALNNADEDSDYALADTFEGAYQEYIKIRSKVDDEVSIANQANDVTITGTVVSNEWVNDESGGSRLINIIEDDTNTSIWFLAPGDSLNAASAQSGKHVSITAYEREGQEYLSVRYITVDDVPDFGGALWDQGSDWIESIFNYFSVH